MLLGIKEYRILRNNFEYLGNTWVDINSIYLVKEILLEKERAYRLTFTQGAVMVTDAESFQKIIEQFNNGQIRVLG